MFDRLGSTSSFFPRFRRTSFFAAIALPVVMSLGCGRNEIVAPTASATIGQFTVDASADWAYFSLSSGAAAPQTAAATSTAWDIAFKATSVMLNGGANGPAGMTGFCICQNGAATDDQILAMTPDNQDAGFTTVTASSIPTSDSSWTSDVFDTHAWYRYNITGDHHISPTFDVYLIKRGSTVYKLQLINYYGPAGEVRQISGRFSQVQN